MTTPDKRRLQLLRKMPAKEEAMVGELYASLLGARSALRRARDLGLCRRVDLIWERTEKGEQLLQEAKP